MSFIYLIEARIGVVKIGVSHSPRSRAASYNTHSPVPCRLIAYWPGTFLDERALHERFKEHRGHSEWFRIEGPVADFVEQTRGTNVPAIEPWWEDNLSRKESRFERYRAEQSERMRRRWADPAFRAQRAAYREFQRERSISEAARASA